MLAARNGHKSIAFPAIGTGALGFSVQEVAHTMSEAVARFAQTSQKMMDVHFVIFPSDSYIFKVGHMILCIVCFQQEVK